VSSTVGSPALALLTTVFGIVMVLAAREFRAVAMLSIRLGFQAQATSAAMLHAKEAAEAANLAKSQFLATMSHEIRTPMNGVLGALDALRRSELGAKQRQLVKAAASSGESLMAMLNDLLDHSKMEAGKLTLLPAPASLQAITASVVNLFRANAERKGLGLRCDIDGSVIDHVICDSQRLKQVLNNLVGNAIKFTEHGQVTLRLSAKPAAAGRAGILFEVRDTGIGLAPEASQYLFQPFHQIDQSVRRSQGGTGLGLAISQRIVEAMGGHIELSSSPGKGSCFYFELCFDIDRCPVQQLASVPVSDSALGGLSMPPERPGAVMVVEDNMVNRLIAREMLQSMGLEVFEVENGAQALEQIGRRPVDIVLMDCQMPVMDGYSATKYIREREQRLGLPNVPIVALTANALDDDTEQALRVGMNAHLVKPYTRRQLYDLLSRWL